ncbi:PD40 domain-containing protein [Agrobacterium tumefaciens]|nr:PD40 domain-containing protein [Agrobacterium tumefaciens]
MSNSTGTFAQSEAAFTRFHAATLGINSATGIVASTRVTDDWYFRPANYLVTGFTSVALALGATGYQSDTLRNGSAATLEVFAPVIVRSALPASFDEAIKEMKSFEMLQDGWDGAGSVKPSRGFIEAATAFVEALPLTAPTPEASASADGAVSWFWDTDEIYATASFSSDGKYAYFARNRVNGTKVGGVSETYLGEIPQEFLEILAAA